MSVQVAPNLPLLPVDATKFNQALGNVLSNAFKYSPQGGEVLDRNFALKSIWNDDNYFNGRSMDVYIAKLRKYLKDDSSIEIVNIHGNGFRLVAPVNV